MGTMYVCIKCHGYPSNGCWDIKLWVLALMDISRTTLHCMKCVCKESKKMQWISVYTEPGMYPTLSHIYYVFFYDNTYKTRKGRKILQ